MEKYHQKLRILVYYYLPIMALSDHPSILSELHQKFMNAGLV